MPSFLVNLTRGLSILLIFSKNQTSVSLIFLFCFPGITFIDFCFNFFNINNKQLIFFLVKNKNKTESKSNLSETLEENVLLFKP